MSQTTTAPFVPGVVTTLPPPPESKNSSKPDPNHEGDGRKPFNRDQRHTQVYPNGVEKVMLKKGDIYQHRKTKEVVRIEVARLGIISFSVRRDGAWVMCQNPWDEVQFEQNFRRFYLQDASG